MPFARASLTASGLSPRLTLTFPGTVAPAGDAVSPVFSAFARLRPMFGFPLDVPWCGRSVLYQQRGRLRGGRRDGKVIGVQKGGRLYRPCRGYARRKGARG